MLVDGSWNFADRTVFHELVHERLASSGTHLPLWLEEGLADYFSTAGILDRAVRFGRVIREHLQALRNRPLMPIAGLFEVQQTGSAATSSFFYAESYAVVDWMMRVNRHSFFAFLDDGAHGASLIGAFHKAL